MAQLTLNGEIMTFGYSGISASHRRADDQIDAVAGSTAQDGPSAPETVFRPVRSLLVQRLNRRG